MILASSSSSWIDTSALWKIIVLGLAAGAGLPAIFAIGLRAVDHRPAAATGTGARPGGPTLAGLALAAVCFAVVLAAIGWSVYAIKQSS